MPQLPKVERRSSKRNKSKAAKIHPLKRNPKSDYEFFRLLCKFKLDGANRIISDSPERLSKV